MEDVAAKVSILYEYNHSDTGSPWLIAFFQVITIHTYRLTF